MEPLKTFASRHPYAAAGSFGLGGVVGAGVSHHFLDLEWPYAAAFGLATGTSTLYVASLVYLASDKVSDAVDAVTEAADTVGTGLTAGYDAATDPNVYKETGKAIVSGKVFADIFGLNDDIDVSYYAKSGNEEQKTLARELQQSLMQNMLGKLDEKGQQRMIQVGQALRDAISAEKNNGFGADAEFTTNKANPEGYYETDRSVPVGTKQDEMDLSAATDTFVAEQEEAAENENEHGYGNDRPVGGGLRGNWK